MAKITTPAPIHDDGTYSAEQMQAYRDAGVREMLEDMSLLMDAGYVVGMADEPEVQHQLFCTH